MNWFEQWAALAGFSPPIAALAVGAVFFAGIVRGFSGFALSAMTVALLIAYIPPLELVAMCWFLEVSASILMVRGGWKEADWSVVKGLVIGSAFGVVIGVGLNRLLPVETSTTVVLMLLIVLAALQLAKVRAHFLATIPGLYGSGIAAGVATGLASIGGMVVALYVLARQATARQMRASLIMYLFASEMAALIALLAYGLMTYEMIVRGVGLAVPTMAGVVCGQILFRPRLERFYKPFCLVLLIGLAGRGAAPATVAGSACEGIHDFGATAFRSVQTHRREAPDHMLHVRLPLRHQCLHRAW